MVDELREYGMELMVSIWPQINLTSENYEEMRKSGLLIKNERGVEIAMRFEGEKYLLTPPIPGRGIMYGSFARKITMITELRCSGWMRRSRNFRYTIMITTVILWGRQLKSEIFTPALCQNLLRGTEEGWDGNCREPYPLRMGRQPEIRRSCLVGDIHSDWETFRKQLCAGLNMGIAGIPWWTTDIGGFFRRKPG